MIQRFLSDILDSFIRLPCVSATQNCFHLLEIRILSRERREIVALQEAVILAKSWAGPNTQAKEQ